jgi:endonuclease YncB( thermonuclease family)
MLAGAAAMVASTMATSHADLYGGARVVDGDTLMIGGQQVRLYGIDAPELEQICDGPGEEIRCGEISRSAVLDLVAGVERVSCKTKGRDSSGQWIAVCYADGSDIGRTMVHSGWALADRQQSLNYVRTEHDAKNAKRGLWKGKFDPPWIWRHQNK